MNRNPRVDCLSLPSLDITKWVDRGDNCLVNGKDIRLGTTERVTPCTVCVCTKEGVSIFNNNILSQIKLN